MKEFDVVIIGAGTSGLTARRQVEKVTSSYIVVDNGPMGTTCARVGCMPSKVFIQVADDYARRLKYDQMGIRGGKELSIDGLATMKHVRALRDRFTRSVYQGMESWTDKLVRKRARLVSENIVDLEGEQVKAKSIVIATGSSPIIPEKWLAFREHLVTTDEFFELERLPHSMAVIGLGVIGCELGQALHRLGVKIVGITTNRRIGGLSDPAIQDYVISKFAKEFPVCLNGADILGISSKGKLQIKADGEIYEVEKALLSMGRSPNVKNLGLENLNIEFNEKGIPIVDSQTLRIRGSQSLFLPGDVNGERPILHEAADDGKIAGINAVANGSVKFKRRAQIGITFTDPNIASAGQSWAQLTGSNIDFEFGEVSFEGQGRSIVKLKEQGLLRVYGDKKSGKILGAEMQAPDGEHLAHLLSWSIQQDLTAFELLKMPFYHPVVEEGLRTALRDLAIKVAKLNNMEFEELDKI